MSDIGTPSLKERFWPRLWEITALTPDFAALDPEPRYQLTQILGYLMSEASEDVYCAGWITGQEDDMPALLLSGERYGTDLANETLMLALAKALGHWAKWESYDKGEQYVPHMPKCLSDGKEQP